MKVKIGILFGDSDFYQTFTTALDLLDKGIRNNLYRFEGKYKSQEIDDDYIVRVLNLTTSACYYGYQNMLLYDNPNPGMSYDYLKITKDNVYIDDKLDELLATEDKYGFNGELFILELDTKGESKIYSR